MNDSLLASASFVPNSNLYRDSKNKNRFNNCVIKIKKKFCYLQLNEQTSDEHLNFYGPLKTKKDQNW